MLPKSASSYLRVIKDWHYIVTTLTPPGQFLTPFLLFDGKEKNLKDMPSLSSASRSDRESLIFRYRIPLSACADFPRNRLPLSAFAALFDEISTWAIVGAERNRSMRPGVSTYLSAHLGQGGLDGLGQELGDTIDFEVDVIKVGRTMAFANISAIDLESGAVICTGRHTKYLPMGLFYETMFHKKVLPVTKAYVRYVNQGVNPYLSLDSVKKTLHDTVEFDAISPDNKKGKILVKANKCNAYGTLHVSIIYTFLVVRLVILS
mmetsp:Transcript_19902/g.45197  ORF Transcript_19902/g.45197 Transcript_19902/m.45197 type:complete len:262 (-) Transcript_19902:463-1248(-)